MQMWKPCLTFRIVNKMKEHRIAFLNVGPAVSIGLYMFSCVVLLSTSRVKISFFKDR